MTHAIAICSGGMDSVTLAYLEAQAYNDLTLVSFNYGQRHKKELNYASQAAKDLDVEWVIVPIDIGYLLAGSALTDPTVDVPFGHYEEESMKLTVVPNRNMIMLSIASGIAVAKGAEAVYIGVHAGDHAIYPDCRPEFIVQCSYTVGLATEGFSHPELHIEAPFVNSTKADIVKIGHALNVPWEKTWSCYLGHDLHCGRCGTCVERREAFQLAGVHDPTEYERYE